MKTISMEDLDRSFSVDFQTGILTWKTTTRVGRNPCVMSQKGYLVVTLNGSKLRVHRVIYAMKNGAWPDGQIDHINGIKTDNRIENLRSVCNSVNQSNNFNPKENNKCGFRGVVEMVGNRVKRFRAEIAKDGRRYSLGYFETAEAASLKYLTEKQKRHPEAFVRFHAVEGAI